MESYRENQEFGLLAMYYDSIGNYELRDKYVEIAIQKDPSDQNVCYLRGLQEKPELIPQDVIERELARYTAHEDWTQRARFYIRLGKHREAAVDYLQGILESLHEENVFSAAYYLKELEKERLVEELFVLALRQATEEGDLWWQIRALEELGWHKELDDLVLQNSEEIERSGNPYLLILLADAKGEEQQSMKYRKDFARGLRTGIVGEEDNDTQD
jgi:tetratricopeptide (TPR) repeat protein